MTGTRGAAAGHDPVTLALDASAALGTVAVFRGRALVAEGEVQMRGGHEERLMPAVHQALGAASVTVRDIDRVVCGAGPGGFTGLRIAASIAKGICAARGVPLYAISSLLSSVGAARPPLPAGDYLSVLDALRGQWFVEDVAVLPDGAIRPASGVRLWTTEQLRDQLRDGGAPRVVGPGWEGDLGPRARGFAPMLDALERMGSVDLATWEPDYGRVAEAQARWEAQHGRPLAP